MGLTVGLDSRIPLAKRNRVGCVVFFFLDAKPKFYLLCKALPNAKLGRYLRAFASWHGLNNNDNSPNISYNTRVELIKKRLDSDGKQIGWTLTTKEVIQVADGANRVTWDAQVDRSFLKYLQRLLSLNSLELRWSCHCNWKIQCPEHSQYSKFGRVGSEVPS